MRSSVTACLSNIFLCLASAVFLAALPIAPGPAMAQSQNESQSQSQNEKQNLNISTLPKAVAETYAKIRLLPERGNISPGEEIWIGIEQSIAPGWHTYWRNPGDSGADPRVRWTLPAGFEIGDIHWPIPRKLPFGPMTNYGYEENVILLQKLKAPATLPEGPLTLTADIEVLVCEEICIPEFGTYTMTLNGHDEEADADNAPYLAAAQSRLPAKAPETARLRKTGAHNIELLLPSAAWCNHGERPCADLEIFPLDWGVVNNTATAEILFDGQNLSLRQQAGDRDWGELENPQILITYTDAQGRRAGVEFAAMPESHADASAAATTAAMARGWNEGWDEGWATNTAPSLALVLLLALAGGMILNLMPCVFPVLSLKALSLVKTAQKDAGAARFHGLAYTGGVILSFLVIAGALIALKGAGSAVGWGFHLQSPVVIILLIYLLFIIGLNLMGFFEISLGALGQMGGRMTGGDGYTASFFTGVLATLVATPCTAPFMAAAIGFALTQHAAVALLVFAFLGLGLALPYLALAFIPALQRILPRPGRWMETFRQLLAFPIFLTCAWLLWVLSQQVGPGGILGAALGVTSITFALWLWRHTPEYGRGKRIALRALAILAALMALGFLPVARAVPPAANMPGMTGGNPAAAFGEVFSPAALETALQSGDPVFVEMTAAWCITCKVNHATSLNIESTHKLFAEKNVKYLIGDWTNYDPAITQYLESFGRNGVPIYVYYAPPSPESGQRPAPALLPQILTPGIVAGALKP